MHLGLSLRLASSIAAGDPISITVDTAPSISGTAKVGSTLTRTAGSYSGAGTITVSNGRWQRDGVDIDPAQTGATYTLVAADDEASVRWAEDVADAGSGDSLTARSNAVSVTYAAPTQNAAPTASGDAVIGESLTGTAGTFNGSDLTIGSEWQVSDNGSTGWTGTGDTDTSSPAQVSGKHYRFATTGSNSGGSLTTYSDAIGPAIAPTITMSGLTGGEAVEGDHASITMSADVGTITARAWGSTSGGSEFGTGTSPTDYTGSTTLYATATVGSIDYTISADIAAGASTIPTTLQTVIDYGDGATLTLQSARPVGQYADGSFFVVSDGDVVISGDAPASVAQPVDGYVAHGLMLKSDILIIDDNSSPGSSNPQGWDEMAGQDGTINVKPTYRTAYDASLNKAPSKTGSPLTVATSGNTGGVVKVVRRGTISTDGGLYETQSLLEKVMHLNVVASAPVSGSVRPPIIGPDLGLNVNDVDYTTVRSFTIPSVINPSYTLSDYVDFINEDQVWNVFEGERRNCLCLGINAYPQFVLSTWFAPAAMYLFHPSTGASDRATLLANFCVKATDAYGTYVTGPQPKPGAAQHGVDQFAMAVTSVLFPGNATLRAASAARISNLNDLAIWADADDVGKTGEFLNQATSTGAGSENKQPFLPEHIGTGQWLVSSATAQNFAATDGDSTDAIARYAPSGAQMMEIGATILGLAEGGWEALWGPQASWDTTNPKFATLQVLDRYILWNGSKVREQTATPAWVKELYDAHRATMPEGGTPVAVADEVLQLTGDFGDLAGANAGLTAFGAITETASGIDIDYAFFSNDETTAFTGANQTLTDRQIRLSHDGVQFGSPISVSATDSVAFTGTRWLQERRLISGKTGIWSVNYPQQNGRNLLPTYIRNIYTGGAIPAGNPVNTETPGLYKYRYGDNPGDQQGYWLYDTQDAVMAAAQTKLIAGGGLWADGVVLSYQWEVQTNDGGYSDITGETSQVYERTADVISTATLTRDVRCKVTATDGAAGSTVLYTPATEMPEAVTVTEDYTTDPGLGLYGIRGGSYEWQSGTGVVRIFPEVGTGFSGVALELNGLVKGQEYTFTIGVTARNLLSGTIAALLDDALIYNAGGDFYYTAGGTASNDLTVTSTGTLTIVGTAVESRMYLDTRFFNAGVTDGYFEVTHVTATPILVSAPAAFTAGMWTSATGSGASEIDIGITTLPDDGGSTITALQYSVDSGTTWANLTGTGTGARTIDQHSDGLTGTLTADTSYNVMVRAVNAEGNGANSDTKATTTGDVAATVPAAMSAPTVNVTSTTALSVDRASAPSDGGSAITSYDLRWSVFGAASWTTETGIAASAEAIGSLTEWSKYEVQTRAVNAIGAGDWSPSTVGVPRNTTGELYFHDFVSSPTIGTGGVDGEWWSAATGINGRIDSHDSANARLDCIANETFGGPLSELIVLDTGETYSVTACLKNNMGGNDIGLQIMQDVSGSLTNKFVTSGVDDVDPADGIKALTRASVTGSSFSSGRMRVKARSAGALGPSGGFFEWYCLQVRQTS